MEILGIGAWELVLILLIMLLVARPKRMIQWSYKLGQYMAVVRRMWGETAKSLQRELDDAGVDIKVPRDLPTRANLTKEIGRAMTPLTKPMQDSINDVRKDIESVKTTANLSDLRKDIEETKRATTVEGWRRTAANAKDAPSSVTPSAPEPAQPAPTSNGRASFGTWSQEGGDPPNGNGTIG